MSRPLRLGLPLGALALALGLAVAPLPGLAQEEAEEEEQEQEQEEENRWQRQEEDPFARMPTPSSKITERYEKALGFYFDEKYEEAIQELGKVYMNRLNPAEESMIHEAYAYVANARGDRAEARRRLTLAVETVDRGGMRPDKALELGYQIAMLWVQDASESEDPAIWREAVSAQEQWFSGAQQAAMVGLAQPPNARAYYMLALSYYQLEEYDKALKPAETAVKKGNPPQEGWLQLLLGIRLIEKQYEEAIPVLEKLASLYPAKGHFVNLSTVYGALGRLEEAALPLQLAYEAGYLETDADLRRLAQLMLYLDLPYRAAQILEVGFESEVLESDVESLSMLGNSWVGAREYDRALEPLERAASLADTGELYVRLAQVHVQRENWDGATDALRKAIDKGKLTDPGDANLLMGIAFYSQEQREQAMHWFQRAQDFDKTRDEAEMWTTHVQAELDAARLEAQQAEEEAELEQALQSAAVDD